MISRLRARLVELDRRPASRRRKRTGAVTSAVATRRDRRGDVTVSTYERSDALCSAGADAAADCVKRRQRSEYKPLGVSAAGQCESPQPCAARKQRDRPGERERAEQERGVKPCHSAERGRRTSRR